MGSIKQGEGVPEEYLKMGEGGGHNKMTLREYWDYTIKWCEVGFDNKMVGEGAMIFIFLLLAKMVNTLSLLLELMCFLTNVFSTRKNVRNWIKSQIFCFEKKDL